MSDVDCNDGPDLVGPSVSLGGDTFEEMDLYVIQSLVRRGIRAAHVNQLARDLRRELAFLRCLPLAPPCKH